MRQPNAIKCSVIGEEGNEILYNQHPSAPYRRNHFTVFDAREAMYRALTGRDVSGNLVAATEAIRNKYWATTFRALGDVVHMLQDMAQPEHTRNEAHCAAHVDQRRLLVLPLAEY